VADDADLNRDLPDPAGTDPDRDATLDTPNTAKGQWSGTAPSGGTPARVKRTPGNSLTPSDAEGVFVVHAVMMYTGHVLWFSGGAERGYRNEATIFNPSTETVVRTVRFPRGGGNPVDVFCSYHVQVEDGSILTIGGTGHGADAQGTGIAALIMLQPHNRRFRTEVRTMAQARWYPTAVVMGDGRILVASGRLEHDTTRGSYFYGDPNYIADKVEVLARARNGYYAASTVTQTAGAGPPPLLWKVSIYPGLHLTKGPNGGTIVYTGTNWGYEVTSGGDRAPNTPTGHVVPIDTHPTRTFQFSAAGATTASFTEPRRAGRKIHPHFPLREEGMSVLLPLRPPNYDAKILLFGGGYAVDASGIGLYLADHGDNVNDDYARHHGAANPKAAEVLDLSTNPPTWTRLQDMHRARVNANGVLLPDGKVLILGGHNGFKWDSRPAGEHGRLPSNHTGVTATAAGTRPSLAVEIFDPRAAAGSNPFTLGARMWQSRTYHSAAVLVPDGRVLVAGGVEPNRQDNGSAGIVLNRKSYQFYSPPYLFIAGTRPEITRLARAGNRTNFVEYGMGFTVDVDVPATNIRELLIMRPNAMTHHTDSEQRLVYLEFTRSGQTLTTSMVRDPSIVPPGYYMVWVVDAAGRVCREAKWLRVARSVSP
jgi:hypothetical protein